MTEEKAKKRPRGRPKGTSQYRDDQGQVVADILHGIEKGNYENPNQGITEHHDRIAGNSEDAKKKRLRRSITQDGGHVKADVAFSVQLTHVGNGQFAINYAVATKTKDIFHGSANKKTKK